MVAGGEDSSGAGGELSHLGDHDLVANVESPDQALILDGKLRVPPPPCRPQPALSRHLKGLEAGDAGGNDAVFAQVI